MTFKEAYKFPLRFYSSWCEDSNHKKLFDFCLPFFHKDAWNMGDKAMEGVVSILNGERKAVAKHSLKEDEGIIYLQDRPFIQIRSWGYLTGIGGLNLSSEEAVQIQKEMSDFIINILTLQK